MLKTLLFSILFFPLVLQSGDKYTEESLYKEIAQEALYQEAGDSHVIEIRILFDNLSIESLPGDIQTSSGHFLQIKKPKLKTIQLGEEIVDFTTVSRYVIKPRRKLFDLYAKIEAIPEKLEALLSIELPFEYLGNASSLKAVLLSKESKLILRGILRFFGVATVRYTLRGPKKIIKKIKANEFRVSFTVLESTTI